uniref:Uncharacterized protein n=1 Tax=Arundo donax TaxID=35708 RepID=A0A0A9CCG6_ARUDO
MGRFHKFNWCEGDNWIHSSRVRRRWPCVNIRGCL